MANSTMFLLFCIFISTIHSATSARLLLQESLPTPLDPTTTPIVKQQPSSLVPPETTPTQPADTSIPPLLTDTPAIPAAPTEPLATPQLPAEPLAPGATPTDSAALPADSAAPPADSATLPADSATPPTNTKPTPLPIAATTPTTPPPHQPLLSFYMHDVLGGTHASGRVVTGIIASSDSSTIPFSKPNNDIFPLSNGVPLSGNQINNILNNNNAPFIASLNGQQQQSQTTIQNTGSNNNVVNSDSNSNAFVSAGQLPAGATLEKLMFGSITVIDDQLTEGHELGAGIIGSAQGIYLASSLNGDSHTMAYTAMFHGDHHDVMDTISFFGVHRVAAPVSQLAVIGGTGKYETARGYATIETVPQLNQLTTDGVDTIVRVTVYLI